MTTIGPGVLVRPGRGRHASPRRHRRWRRVVASLAAVVLVLGAGAVATLMHFTGNIASVTLPSGVLAHPTAEPTATTSVTMLLIGTDARRSAEDCAIGRDCSDTATNADVLMLAHLSADRSHAEVLSIPRDTMVPAPPTADCRGASTVATASGSGGHTASASTSPPTEGELIQINSTLNHGDGCTVSAVSHLTGVPIDHYLKVNFSGVRDITAAVGGVRVCVSDNLYDDGSHLRMAKGEHLVEGLSALAYLRTRHAFGDGSDISRTHAQHLFLSSMIGTITQAGTLMNPIKVARLTEAATKALTVDSELKDIGQMVDLARAVTAIQPDQITMLTLPVVEYPADPNRRIPAPSAERIYEALRTDTPLARRPARTPSTSPSASASPAVTLTSDDALTVLVHNGTGRPGVATAVAADLQAKGLPRAAAGPDRRIRLSRLHYAPRDEATARALIALWGLPESALVADRTSGMVVYLGADWTYQAPTPTPTPSTSSALGEATSEGGATSADAAQAGCAQVSQDRTINLRYITGEDRGVTPARAYELTSPTTPGVIQVG